MGAFLAAVVVFDPTVVAIAAVVVVTAMVFIVVAVAVTFLELFGYNGVSVSAVVAACIEIFGALAVSRCCCCLCPC